MIGTDLNLTLPSNSETMAENVARIATALEVIEDSIAQKATPAALNINAPLELNGNALTEVASVQFASGNMTSIAGSFYYYGGAWWLVDQVGAIQVTENGVLKATGFGAITGDYGGSNPAAVTYVDANGQYVFTEDTGVYADLVADDLILQGTSGRVQFNVDAALTGDRNINIKSLASSGTALVVYDASDESLSTTNDIPTPTAPDYKYTTARTRWIPLGLFKDPAGAHAYQAEYWQLNSSNQLHVPVSVEGGERITGWTVYFTRTSIGTTINAQLYKVTTTGTLTPAGAADSDSGSVGAGTLDVTGLTEDIGSYANYLIIITGATFTIKAANITVTRP